MRVSALKFSEGERIPWWGGIAWPMQNQMAWVVLPLGLHWIAGWMRRVWHEFKIGYQGQSAIALAAHEGFKSGYRIGQNHADIREYERGFDKGTDMTLRILARRERP